MTADPAPARPPVAEGERWGWELRAPEVPLPVPFEEEPPGLPVVDAPWSARLAGSRDRSAQGLGAHVRRFGLAAVSGTLTWLSTALPFGFAGWITGGLAVLAGVLAFVAVRPVVLPWWCDLRYRRWRRGLLDRQQEVTAQTREWVRRRDEHRDHLASGVQGERWEPLRPATTHRVDVYGGDPRGCESLLVSVAGSLLDTGANVTVVDLSQDGICHGLFRKASVERRPMTAALLPTDLAAVGLLDGLTPEDIGGVVAEAVHVLEREPAAGGDKTLDATLVEQICGCLRGPVTFARLHAAVRVVAHQEGAPDALSREEYDGLVDLLGEGARRSTEGRLFRLTAALQRLAAMEPPGLGAAGGRTPRRDVPLQVWELSERVGDLGGELLAHVVFQVLLHRLRHEEQPGDRSGGRVLVVLGADRFRRTHLERLDQLARRRGVRLVLFFRHLREDAVDLLGGGEAVMFMRLGNAKEAEHAATFIGKDHRVVLGQYTVSRSSGLATRVGTSTTESVSDQESVTNGKQWSTSRNYHYGALLDFPHDSGSRNRGEQRSTTLGRSTSTSVGDSQSEQTSTSDSQALGYQRVYEFTVEPKFLQALSPTAFVLVDPRDPGSPRLGDCGPDLAAEQPSVTSQPPAAGLATGPTTDLATGLATGLATPPARPFPRGPSAPRG